MTSLDLYLGSRSETSCCRINPIVPVSSHSGGEKEGKERLIDPGLHLHLLKGNALNLRELRKRENRME